MRVTAVTPEPRKTNHVPVLIEPPPVNWKRTTIVRIVVRLQSVNVFAVQVLETDLLESVLSEKTYGTRTRCSRV